MIKGFEKLSESEYQTLKDSVTWVTVLIAGADDKIEPKEIEWADKLTKIRSYSGPEKLNQFYQQVGDDFTEKVENLIETLPDDLKKRNEALAEKLSRLNPILAKLETKMGAEVYKSLTSFAHHVATATGGFLRFFSVSSEEKKLTNLPMVTEIIYVDDHEYDDEETAE